MNHKRIARLYLNWFAQEAQNLCLPPKKEETILWSDDGTFAIGYEGYEGFRSYQGFVGDLATSRLDTHDANGVLLAAEQLVNEANRAA